MEKLRDTFEDIISGNIACEDCSTPTHHKLVIRDLINAVKAYTDGVIGESQEKVSIKPNATFMQRLAKSKYQDELKVFQRIRAKENL